MRHLKYGGQIVPGDFIVISYNNYLDFGWYAGNGSGTLQYYGMRGPGCAYKDYEDWLKMTDKEKAENRWASKRFEKGFTRKCFWKSYISSPHPTRIMKITNIEDIFTEREDRELYERSKEAMIKVNLIKQD